MPANRALLAFASSVERKVILNRLDSTWKSGRRIDLALSKGNGGVVVEHIQPERHNALSPSPFRNCNDGWFLFKYLSKWYGEAWNGMAGVYGDSRLTRNMDTMG